MTLQGKKPLVEKIVFLESNIECYSFIKNMHSTLKKFCRKIIHFGRMNNYFKYGKKEMNRRLLALIKKERPDYIFTWLTWDEFYIETLLKIREISPKTKTVAIFGDDSSQFDNFSRYYSLLFDYSFTTLKRYHRKYKKDGVKGVFDTNLTDTHSFKPLIAKRKYDVTFVGSQKLDKSGRYEMIKYLKDNGIKVRVYGFGWKNFPEMRDIYHGSTSNEEMVQILNESKINLCFSKDNFGRPQLKAKAFEVSACNSFMLCEFAPDYNDYFKEGKEIIMFRGKEDLLKKVKYYLKNKKAREKIALKAYKKTVRDYGLYNEIKYMIEKTKNKTEHSELPKVKGDVFVLTRNEIKLSREKLKALLNESDYVAFRSEGVRFSPYKNYFQSYALEKTGKEISCCDYYVNSKKLGDYVKSDCRYAFGLLDKRDASSMININQIVVRKDYFLKNLDMFKGILNGRRIDFVELENTAFVSMPLVRINKIEIKDYNKFKESFSFKFLYKLYSLVKNKRLLVDKYTYNLLAESLKSRFIFDVLKNTFMNKDYWMKLKKYN